MARIDSLRLATALAAAIDEAVHDLATHADLAAMEQRLEHRLTIRFGGVLAAGLGLLFAAMQVFHR